MQEKRLDQYTKKEKNRSYKSLVSLLRKRNLYFRRIRTTSKINRKK